MPKLTGATSLPIDVPHVGRITYHQGEEVPLAHLEHVPEDQSDLFEEPKAKKSAKKKASEDGE